MLHETSILRKTSFGICNLLGRGVKEVIPRIDFTERAEPSAGPPGKGRGVNTEAGMDYKSGANNLILDAYLSAMSKGIAKF